MHTCVTCQRGGPMNGRGMKGRKEDGPAVEESRCVRSIPIVYTYRTWRRRLSWVCPISRAQHPAFVSCVLSLFLSCTCLYRSLFLAHARFLRRDIEPRGSLNSRRVKSRASPTRKAILAWPSADGIAGRSSEFRFIKLRGYITECWT